VTLEADRPPASRVPASRVPASRGSLQDWRVLLAVFWITSLVEGLVMSQVFAFLPQYLLGMGVHGEQRLQFVGLFSALVFIVGAPLVPLWGVWADKYSRKAVIARSAIVEAIVIGAVALSREPWQLALSLLLIGFQLGNTGVMLASIRDATPRRHLGTAIALFGASGPVGQAAGPIIAGILVDGFHQSLPFVYGLSACFSVGTALLVTFGTREVRPDVVPTGPSVQLAYGAVRFVLSDRWVRRVFLVFGSAFLISQMARPYIPVLVEHLTPVGGAVAANIGLVAGTAALAGAAVSPLGGALGDRIGFRRVLIGALLLAGGVVTFAPFAPSLAVLAVTVLLFFAANAVVAAMVFGLLATEVPSERRSTTLNLVYLPLYAAGIVGPVVGSIVVTGSLWMPFALGLSLIHI